MLIFHWLGVCHKSWHRPFINIPHDAKKQGYSRPLWGCRGHQSRKVCWLSSMERHCERWDKDGTVCCCLASEIWLRDRNSNPEIKPGKSCWCYYVQGPDFGWCNGVQGILSCCQTDCGVRHYGYGLNFGKIQGRSRQSPVNIGCSKRFVLTHSW